MFHPEQEEFEAEFKKFSEDNPEYANKEFQDYFQKQKFSKDKMDELYEDDEPYDGIFDDEKNEEEQLEHLQR
jgi:hypothetical protein